jgi:hypothetical protein
MSAVTDIAGFLAKYSPAIAGQLRAARKKLKALIPRGYEQVYDNYNALVFGFGPTEKSSDSVISIAGYPKWVTLFFLWGARLDDPHGLLEGSGAQVRGIRLTSPKDLDSPKVKALIRQALDPKMEAFADAPKMKTVIKSISKKQRPRRPK